jgi:OOP family OmpA-OmpF porin
MRLNLKSLATGLAVALAVTGCSHSPRQAGCTLAGGLAGGVLGGVGGGLGTSEIGKNPSNSDRAAGAGVGAAVGATIGALLGNYLCREEAAPPPPKPAPPPPPPPARGTKIETLTGANFDFNKSTLRPDGKAKIDHAIKVMQDHTDLRVSVEGHTDSIGSDAYNQKLSERRAQTVRDYMVAKSISASRVSTRGFGKTKPIASNKTAEGRAQNRRVEIVAE